MSELYYNKKYRQGKVNSTLVGNLVKMYDRDKKSNVIPEEECYETNSNYRF